MRRVLFISICAIPMSLGPLFGQGVTVVGAGYSAPSIIRVAPGQITTFFVTGLKTVLSQPAKAASLPLPNALAGISVTLNQPGPKSYPAPLLAVQQISTCNDGGGAPSSSSSSLAPECLTTAVTVQIPFELPYLDPVGALIDTEVVVNESGSASKGFRVYPMMDNMHILNTCDSFPPVSSTAVSCAPVVTHGDGTLVTAASPARAGEEIVVWAFGLGKTQIPVQTGVATPPGIVPINSLEYGYVLFDLSTNAAPKTPVYPNQSESYPIETIYAGLTAGYVGLYQINITLPKSLVTRFACGKGFHSNLTIDMGLIASFDGAPICIEATQ
jgi:hypothetical protein